MPSVSVLRMQGLLADDKIARGRYTKYPQNMKDNTTSSPDDDGVAQASN